MVCFICDGCGDTVKRSKIDDHARGCRSCDSVSCADCHVAFYGDDYKSHTSCVSEAERYEKSMYRGNNGKNKKKNPSEQWMDLISEAVESGPAHLRGTFQTLSTYDNIPRKEKQFLNFVSNSLSRNQDYSKVWEHLNSLRQNKIQEQKIKEAESNDDNETVNKKHDHEQTAPSTTEVINNESSALNSSSSTSITQIKGKDVAKVIKKVLKREPNRQMKMKELRRKVKLSLMFEGKKEELKKLIQDQLDNDTKKIVIEKKVVRLL